MRFQRQSLQPGLAVLWGQAKAPVPSHPLGLRALTLDCLRGSLDAFTS